MEIEDKLKDAAGWRPGSEMPLGLERRVLAGRARPPLRPIGIARPRSVLFATAMAGAVCMLLVARVDKQFPEAQPTTKPTAEQKISPTPTPGKHRSNSRIPKSQGKIHRSNSRKSRCVLRNHQGISKKYQRKDKNLRSHVASLSPWTLPVTRWGRGAVSRLKNHFTNLPTMPSLPLMGKASSTCLWRSLSKTQMLSIPNLNRRTKQ